MIGGQVCRYPAPKRQLYLSSTRKTIDNKKFLEYNKENQYLR